MGFRFWLYLPLLSQGQLIGGLNFGRAAGNPFTVEEEVYCSRGRQPARHRSETKPII